MNKNNISLHLNILKKRCKLRFHREFQLNNRRFDRVFNFNILHTPSLLFHFKKALFKICSAKTQRLPLVWGWGENLDGGSYCYVCIERLDTGRRH